MEEFTRHLAVNMFGNNLLTIANEKPYDPWAWKNEGIFASSQQHTMNQTNFLPSDTNDHYDFFDGGLKRYKCIQTNLKSQLFRYFTFAELGSDSYDDLALTLHDLTEDGGVKKLVLIKGKGEKVIHGGYVWMHYVTFVEGNDEPIDSTRNKELLTAYKVGGGQMLSGVELCITSMEVGEIAKVLIKPEYAYGKFGCPTLIPPNSRILMAIEIVKATDEPLTKPIHHMKAKERKEVSLEEIFKCAEKLRLAGNRKFTFDKYFDSIERYEKAIEILEDVEVEDEKDVATRSELQYKLFSNIALCQLRVEDPAQALAACEAALAPGMPPPKDAKVYYRYSEAAFLLGDLEKAKAFIDLSLQMEPTRLEFRLFKRQINTQIGQLEAEKNALYKKMTRALFN